MNEDSVDKLKRGFSDCDVLEVILRRWSPRAFATTPVTDTELKTIFEAARWAASSYNEQPWRFVVGRQGDAAWTTILDALVDANQTWARTAPVLFATFAKKTFSHNGELNRHRVHDVGAACANLSLQAGALGLHTHGMAGFKSEQLAEALHLPDDFEPVACWALGRFGNPADLAEFWQGRELLPRARKGAAEVVFGNVWDEAATLNQ